MKEEVKVVEKNKVSITAREFLLGGLITAAMKHMRSLDKPWVSLPEEKQRKVIDQMTDDIRNSVREAVDIIASDGRNCIRAGVESVSFKKGAKLSLLMKNTRESRELAELVDSTGSSVLVVLESPSRYLALGESVPKAEADQRSLEMV